MDVGNLSGPNKRPWAVRVRPIPGEKIGGWEGGLAARMGHLNLIPNLRAISRATAMDTANLAFAKPWDLKLLS